MANQRHFPKVETSVLQGGGCNEPRWSRPGDGVITQHQQRCLFPLAHAIL